MIQRRAWMQALTRPGWRLRQPFSAEFEGRTWDAATNGHAIVLVETDSPAYERGGPPLDVALNADRRTVGVVDLETVRDWAFTAEEDESCEFCGGSSRLPVNPGRVHGALINRALLFVFLPPGAHGSARLSVGDDLEPILLDGGNWRVYIMPIKAETPEELAAAPEFPNG